MPQSRILLCTRRGYGLGKAHVGRKRASMNIRCADWPRYLKVQGVDALPTHWHGDGHLVSVLITTRCPFCRATPCRNEGVIRARPLKYRRPCRVLMVFVPKNQPPTGFSFLCRNQHVIFAVIEQVAFADGFPTHVLGNLVQSVAQLTIGRADRTALPVPWRSVRGWLDGGESRALPWPDSSADEYSAGRPYRPR